MGDKMSYDPCGTQRLEGDELIKRLAVYLQVPPADLKQAFVALVTHYQIKKMDGE
jgi:hypothetical protein